MAARRLWARRKLADPAARLPLLDFIPAITPRYQRPTHLLPLIKRLERMRHEPIRLVVSTPPRHAKTETILHTIAWILEREPTAQLGYISYAVDFARSKSRKARILARAAGVELAEDAARLEDWRTSVGGGLLASGIGGQLTGHGLDVLLVDDPVKNRVEAESPTYRDRTWEWFNDVAYTRLEPHASAVVVQTRWHPDDLAGRLIAQGWEHLELPAINAAGAPLWPERWTLEQLQEIRDQVGEYTWASLYQCTPRSRGGQVFRDVAFYEQPPAQCRITIGIDFAYTAKKHADYSVAVVLGEHERVRYVLEVHREQVDATAFARSLAALRERYRGARMVAYVGGTEKGVVDLINAQAKLSIEARTAAAIGDKFVRAQPVAAAWNAGKVLVPRNAAWVDAFVTEVSDFTGVNDAHDDQVDALAAAFDGAYLSGSMNLQSVQAAMPKRRF